MKLMDYLVIESIVNISYLQSDESGNLHFINTNINQLFDYDVLQLLKTPLIRVLNVDYAAITKLIYIESMLNQDNKIFSYI